MSLRVGNIMVIMRSDLDILGTGLPLAKEDEEPLSKKPPPKTSPPQLVTSEETVPPLDSEEGEAVTTTAEVSTKGRPSPPPTSTPTQELPRNGAVRPAAKGEEPAEEEAPEETKEERPNEEPEPAEEEPATDQPSEEKPALKQPAAKEQPTEEERRPTPRTVVETTRGIGVPETRSKSPRAHVKTEKKQKPTPPPTAVTASKTATPEPTVGIKRLPEMSHPLLCTVSSLAVEELRYPHEYCTHVIYTHAEFDFAKKSFVAPMASLSFSSFLNSKSKWANNTEGPRYMISLSPAFVAQHAPEMSTGQRATRDMATWLESMDLAGIALVEHFLTPDNVDLYVKFSSVREVTQGGLEFVLGFSSAYLKELQPTLKILYSQVDYIILETHVKQFPDNCMALFPTAFNASRNPKVLQLKNNLFPRSALQYAEALPAPGTVRRAKTCISVLMGVLMYIVPKGLIHAPSQDCIDFSWCTYSDVCQSKSKFKYYEWAEAVTQSEQSRMYMFDDETTIVNKVRKAKHVSPNTCVSLYRTDLDDFSGTCNNGSPFLRVAAVRRAVFS
ncbi:hypothetical protein HPB51_002036 [Rhipicephalus microplus]|uniref:Uncharacterized protein n=1 Tax=Rhipicephalus microplus TaxID=6941 RepID=A0A9J6DXY6_RHIMP|nr:hypothetical protein HPB51_002036 [Rhipicephalus microplus]